MERGAGQTAHGLVLVPCLAPALSAFSWLRPRAPHSREPGRAQSLPSSASRRRLEAESPAARPQCLAWCLALGSRPLRPERTEVPLPTLASRAGGSREHLSVRLSRSPAFKGTHPCPTVLCGERPSHLPAARAPQGSVPSGGAELRLGGKSRAAVPAGCLGGRRAVPVVWVSLPRPHYTLAPCLTCRA